MVLLHMHVQYAVFLLERSDHSRHVCRLHALLVIEVAWAISAGLGLAYADRKNTR